MIDSSERPIAKCQAIKTRMRQSGKGLFIEILVKEDLPPEEFIRDFKDLKVGDVFNLYATVDAE